MPTDVQSNFRWQDQKVVKDANGAWVVEGHPRASVSLVFQQSPTNTPNHYYIALKATSPVNSATPPHTHAGGAIIATVTRGRVLNQTVCPGEDPDGQGSGPKIYEVGESWYEPPGCHHVRSENAGDEECEFVACFVVAKETVDNHGLRGLVVIDREVEEQQNKASG